MLRRAGIFLLCLLLVWPVTVPAQRFGFALSPFLRVTRGAYLQMGTPTSVVIRWRTSVASSTLVRYGLTPRDLALTAGNPGKRRDHAVLLTDLAPNTRYYYAIGTTNRILQAGPLNFFHTAPLVDAIQSVRVWVIGDPGTGSTEQKAVRDAYWRWSLPTRRTDLVLALGDNAYDYGTDWDYQTGFFDIYLDVFKQVVVWPTLGNHDGRSADSRTETGVYYNVFTLPRRGQAGGFPSGTAAYYSFEYGNTHFICLNSQDVDRSPTGPMLTWLRRDLAGQTRTWTVAFWHHCPYTKGSHDSDDMTKEDDKRMNEMRQNALPILEAAGVDLVLCGHTHMYERSFPLLGHYGKSTSLTANMILSRRPPSSTRAQPTEPQTTAHPLPVQGTVYVNAGSAGHATKPKDLHGLNHPVMDVSLNLPGSLVLDISGPTLHGTFLDENGVVRDHFILRKTRP